MIVFLRPSNWFLKIVTCSDPGCTVQTLTNVDSTSPAQKLYQSFVLSSTGLPLVSYYDSLATDLKLSRSDDAACIGTKTITGVLPMAMMLASSLH